MREGWATCSRLSLRMVVLGSAFRWLGTGMRGRSREVPGELARELARELALLRVSLRVSRGIEDRW